MVLSFSLSLSLSQIFRWVFFISSTHMMFLCLVHITDKRRHSTNPLNVCVFNQNINDSEWYWHTHTHTPVVVGVHLYFHIFFLILKLIAWIVQKKFCGKSKGINLKKQKIKKKFDLLEANEINISLSLEFQIHICLKFFHSIW